jgi:hypothetical protein
MSRLAADYGISGNGPAKICDRLKIPYPPRGYWAKKAAGQKVVQYRPCRMPCVDHLFLRLAAGREGVSCRRQRLQRAWIQ